MKEKIWIEKLEILLNDFDPYISKDGEHCPNVWFYQYLYSEYSRKRVAQAYIVSKSYWFIKRLVDNNKIDISKLWKKSDMWFGDKYTREESLLMLLSISDTPIEDLLLYLK
jgi:hypothetical protein